MTTRAEWQQFARDRVLDVQALLASGRWSVAYYLIGYAVEGALKSCVLARVTANPGVIYESRHLSNDAWTHDFEKLLAVADIKADRDRDVAANIALYRSWQRVKSWTEQSRYERKTQVEAQQLFDAITDPNNGVLQWVQARW